MVLVFRAMSGEDIPVPTTDSGAASTFNIEDALGGQMDRDGSLGDRADLASQPSLGHDGLSDGREASHYGSVAGSSVAQDYVDFDVY